MALGVQCGAPGSQVDVDADTGAEPDAVGGGLIVAKRVIFVAPAEHRLR